MNNTTTLQEPHTSLPDADLPAGTIIDGRFSVISKIGTGGMGSVCLADNTRLKRRIAVEVVSGGAGEIALERFTREVRLMAGIHSPGIVQSTTSAATASPDRTTMSWTHICFHLRKSRPYTGSVSVARR